MRWMVVIAAMVVAGPAAGQARGLKIEMSGPVQNEDSLGSTVATVWVRLTNGSRENLSAYVNCVFFNGGTPVAEGIGQTGSTIPPGGQESVRARGLRPGFANRAECSVRAANLPW